MLRELSVELSRVLKQRQLINRATPKPACFPPLAPHQSRKLKLKAYRSCILIVSDRHIQRHITIDIDIYFNLFIINCFQ